MYPTDTPDLTKFWLVDMFTSCTEPGEKNQILVSFASSSSVSLVLPCSQNTSLQSGSLAMPDYNRLDYGLDHELDYELD